jgi:hypothetical protein
MIRAITITILIVFILLGFAAYQAEAQSTMYCLNPTTGQIVYPPGNQCPAGFIRRYS